MDTAALTKQLADKTNESDELGREIADLYRELRAICLKLADKDLQREQLKQERNALYAKLHR